MTERGEGAPAGISLIDVTKVYRDRTVAVRSLDITIVPGELFVLLGPSGSGKSTILRLIAGLEFPTEGRILIGERDVTDKSPRDRNVAMVLQNYALYPHMTVRKNIAFGLQAARLKKPEVEDRVRRVAEVLGIEDILDKRPRTLSGGQQQRVAMGRAIVREPTAFLMDEPLSNVDVRSRAQIRAEIVRVQREIGVTTIYVTHDQSEALVLGDRVGVLREGRVVQVSAPADLYRRPENLFVAGFVGSPPMNLAEATVEVTDGGRFLRFGGHRLTLEGGPSFEALAPYEWRQVVVGVRPEDFVLASSERTAPDAGLAVTADRIETAGVDRNVFFTMDALLVLREIDASVEGADTVQAEPRNEWAARLGEVHVQEGERLHLTVDPARLHLFDPRTGESIS